MEIWGKWLDYSGLKPEVSSFPFGPEPPPALGLTQSLSHCSIFEDHLSNRTMPKFSKISSNLNGKRSNSYSSFSA
jgi:hypothetical protein